MKRIVQTRRAVLTAGVAAGILQTVGSLAFVRGADAAATAVLATTTVNVRKGPGTRYEKIGRLRKGDRVGFLGAEGNWTKVEYKGKPGYVYSKYLTDEGGSSSGGGSAKGTVYVTENLNLRTKPSLSATIRTVASKGTRLGSTGQTSGQFTQVIWNNQTLWGATRYLSSEPASDGTPTATKKMRATADLMIRTTPDRNYKSLGDVPKGTILDCTDTVTNGMQQALWQGNARWFNAKYLKAVNGSASPAPDGGGSTTTKFATAELNVWISATGSKFSGTIAKGSEVQVTGTVTSGRAQIIHNGATRWVTARYVSASAPASGGGDGGSLNRGWSSGLDKTNVNVKKIVRHVWANMTQIKTMYGWRRDVTPDHPAGRAVDIMIPNYRSNKALGQEIAEYFKANHSEFRIHYIIWNQKIWNVSRSKEGWRAMASRGSDTANHKDHVHITCYDN